MASSASAKRYGIVTINDTASNYGNRLQNYALEMLLSDYGTATTIQHYLDAADASSLAKISARRTLSEAKKAVLGHVPNPAKLEYRRRWEELRFTARYIGRSPVTISQARGLSANGKNLDKIVLGSDQIWNDRCLSQGDLKIRLGMFMPSEQVISYAASFGVDHVKKEHEGIFRLALERMSMIGVREFRAKELVEELSGRKATVVLDPTLMIPAERWRTITRGFVPEGERYVLTYFLGGISEDRGAAIEAFAKTHGCKVRKILDPSDPATYVAGPQDFVELFSKASYVCTDSYHACCFSLLFGKPFRVFAREGVKQGNGMNSRMETLFRLFDLDASIEGGADVTMPSLDYARIGDDLEKQRERSRAWLKQSVNAL
ncbi:polysaccharide pyruvyl transferase family protein [Bifidobacterium sp. 82T10]|uniref:Polysaccharide pyruvyl transferase family protein n=1 Tax=Bifidobacterium miconis TaxID=2834435 RepID=A0ABS6WCF1_9BIFI|nr:polysaccharide pyruvyl transferase family protein [Bifidobacterium miconis]MBW3091721.1 polysaccharide pyruvyl transferase family protein [Bifidobacterium miconis]